MDGEIFESGKKKLQIQNSDPYTCGQGLKENVKTFKFEHRGSAFITKPLKGNGNAALFQYQRFLKLQWNLGIRKDQAGD